jgi:uncharacterized protein (TIGR00106 family)
MAEPGAADAAADLPCIAEICVIPITGSTSVRAEVARAHQILLDAGLEVELHAYGTNVAGPMSTVLAAIERIHRALHDDGVPRIHTAVKIGTRTDKSQTMSDKVQVVHELL